jgi:hypothetical protein
VALLAKAALKVLLYFLTTCKLVHHSFSLESVSYDSKGVQINTAKSRDAGESRR